MVRDKSSGMIVCPKVLGTVTTLHPYLECLVKVASPIVEPIALGSDGLQDRVILQGSSNSFHGCPINGSMFHLYGRITKNLQIRN
jgi:hypothetical protein